MSGMTEDQVAEFQETFNLFDTRGDNKIEVHQLGSVLRALGLNPTEMDVRKCVPKDADARISFEHFIPVYKTIARNKDVTPIAEFIEGFKVFDREQKGTISSAEIRYLLTSLGERMTEDEVDQLLQGVEDKDGNVNYEEFIQMVMNG